MVNNGNNKITELRTILQKHSSNINSTNNHLSPQLTEHKNNTTTYDVGNTVPGSGQAQTYGGIPVNQIPTFSCQFLSQIAQILFSISHLVDIKSLFLNCTDIRALFLFFCCCNFPFLHTIQTLQYIYTTRHYTYYIAIFLIQIYIHVYICFELIPISQVITYEMVMIRAPDNFLFYAMLPKLYTYEQFHDIYCFCSSRELLLLGDVRRMFNVRV